MTTVLSLSAASFGHTGRMYSRLEEVELPSSPPRTRKGRPPTTSCVAVPCLRRCGGAASCLARSGGALPSSSAHATASGSPPRFTGGVAKNFCLHRMLRFDVTLATTNCGQNIFCNTGEGTAFRLLLAEPLAVLGRGEECPYHLRP